jgi:two-component system, LuxR family, sensor kinase FixL
VVVEALSVTLFGIAMLSGVIALLAVSLWSSRRALSIDQGKATAILAAAVDAIITIDEHGLIESFNPAAERLFGYRAAEVMGRNVRMLIPEPYHSEHDRYLDHYRNTGQARIIGIGREVEGRRKDGSIFPMELTVGESRRGRRRLFAGIVRDISERKRSEQELRDSEAKTRAILATAVDGIITIDPQGTILTANPATERLFGYRVDEMVGRKVNILMPDPYRSAHDGYLQRYLTTGERRIIGIGREVQGLRKMARSFRWSCPWAKLWSAIPASSPASCATSPNANEARKTCALPRIKRSALVWPSRSSLPRSATTCGNRCRR